MMPPSPVPHVRQFRYVPIHARGRKNMCVGRHGVLITPAHST